MAGPLVSALEKFIHDRLVSKLVAEGTSQTDAEAAVGAVASNHPLLDLFMQYGLPFILQLLQNLLALGVHPAPAPTPAPTPSA